MADKRYAAVKAALEQYGAALTKEQLMLVCDAHGALPAEMHRNLQHHIQPMSAAFDLSVKNAPEVLGDAPLWAACGSDAKAAMSLAAMDAGIDGDALTVENLRFLTAALHIRYAGRSVRDSLAEAAELIAEEGRTARMVTEAFVLAQTDAAHLPARMAWRYGQGSCMSRLAQLIAALLTETDNGDELYAAFYQEKPELKQGDYKEAAAQRRLSVELLGPACLTPGKARACMLTIHNDSDGKMLSALRSGAEGAVKAMTAAFTTVDAHKSVTIPYTAWLPEETDTITERNVLSCSYAGMELKFGLAGAQGWRVRGRRLGQEAWSAWEAHFAQGNELMLDALNGCAGAYEMELVRVYVLRKAQKETLRVTHTCGFSLEMDGKPLLQGEATDGWEKNTAETELTLETGEHEMRIRLVRQMPCGSIRIDHMQEGQLLAMESVNPLKGLK